MNKIIYLLFLPIALLFADEEVIPYKIESNINLNGLHLLVLSDNSIWEVYPLEKNKQTWPEWWNNISPEQADDRFYFNVTNWPLLSDIIIYDYKWCESELSKIYKNNQKNLQLCNYLIENCETKELIFAKPIHFNALIDYFLDYAEQRYNDGYSYGYSIGYSNGYSDGYSSGSSY